MWHLFWIEEPFDGFDQNKERAGNDNESGEDSGKNRKAKIAVGQFLRRPLLRLFLEIKGYSETHAIAEIVDSVSHDGETACDGTTNELEYGKAEVQ